MTLSDELVAFFESGVAMLVATRDSANVPTVTRGWGARVSEDRRGVVVYVSTIQSTQLFRDLSDNGAVAVTFSRPTDLRTIQMKASGARECECNAADEARIRVYRDAFSEELTATGLPREEQQGLWCEGHRALELRPTQLFHQTPGPGAGEPWKAP